MTDWAVVWLGVIAGAVAIMAAVQLGLIVVSLRLVRQLSATAEEIRRDVGPLVEKAHRIADEAARATALATVQIERIDEILTTTAARIDDGLGIVRNAMGGPLRQGFAVAMALRAAFSAFRQRARPDRPQRDEEDGLFVG